jgi:predicted nuclease of predicted toxin-antitoxin system
LRFLLDECVPTYITALLRDRGHDVLDLRDAGLRGADDRTLLEIAAREGRIIITRDLGFNLLFVRDLQPKGLVLLRYPEMLTPKMVTKLFEGFIDSGGLERCPDNIAVLTPGRARFRPLPKPRGDSGGGGAESLRR